MYQLDNVDIWALDSDPCSIPDGVNELELIVAEINAFFIYNVEILSCVFSSFAENILQ